MQVFSTLLFCTIFETLLLVQILIILVQLDDLIFFYDFSKICGDVVDLPHRQQQMLLLGLQDKLKFVS
jgi:hypothetical protein